MLRWKNDLQFSCRPLKEGSLKRIRPFFGEGHLNFSFKKHIGKPSAVLAVRNFHTSKKTDVRSALDACPRESQDPIVGHPRFW